MASNRGNQNSSSSNRSGGNRQNRSRSEGGVIDTARERPFRTAAVAAAAVGAGAFLWSRRDQISQLSDQIGEWASSMNSGESSDLDDTGGLTTASSQPSTSTSGSRSRKSQPEIAEEALTLKQTGAEPIA